MATKPIPNLLTDATPEEMNADFEIMQRNRECRMKEHPPTAQQMAVFQQQFNEFIHHRRRPFEPMVETMMKL
ncbi:hypothetical protein [Trichlorobacter lovleyi]|uniref:Uncharacterized protein n=1 Tax=Trichlorobacter lovleyi (strain ATCC BAA-1151 / DSM 17278 / SZ) TaxID=398767 RepID=B3E2G7_TRIL1|nr:hypothetical protein [Trichlorobacter lovleyi]ACD94220.1 hypothetical protein Glov_0492 [Trichlorobacter lovleyi SZ]